MELGEIYRLDEIYRERITVADDPDLRAIVGNILGSGIVRGFEGMYFPAGRHRLPELTLSLMRWSYPVEGGQYFLVPSASVIEQPELGRLLLPELYHVTFPSHALDAGANVTLVTRGMHVGRIKPNSSSPRSLAILAGRDSVLPEDMLDARLDIEYAERSTEEAGRFKVLGIERSIVAYGERETGVDHLFQLIIDRVLAHDAGVEE